MQQMILLRMWRERRLMIILLVGMCLLTGFLALSPLYVQAINAAELETRIESARNVAMRLDVVNDAPMDESVRTTTNEILGDFTTRIENFETSATSTCGFRYVEGEELTEQTPRTTLTGCYISYSYPNFDDLFTLDDGALPTTGAPNGIVQALITRSLADDSDWDIGERFIYGESVSNAITVEIVGIVEPSIPQSDPFWERQIIFNQLLVAVSAIDVRFDHGFITLEEDFQNFIVPRQENTQFTWRVQFDRTAINARTLPTLRPRFNDLSVALQDQFPTVELRSSLGDLINTYEQNVTETQRPVTFLSLIVLVPMLYSMVMIATLIQDQQMQEWAMFASRGSSRRQLLFIQFVTVGILNIMAILLGPLLAYGLLVVLSFVGPQANVIELRHISNISPTMFGLAGLAGLFLQIVLMLPAWRGATTSLLVLQRATSRPTVKPLWMRYGVDLLLLFGGIGLVIRLYTLTTGDGIITLLDDPSQVLRVLAEGDISILLSDPFSLLAPALLLTGLTMLWMRLFPLLMGLLGGIVSRRNDLLLRLALWRLERDPAHYTQMVILLIGTLALGTASLVLTTTRETGVWEIARSQVGADATVTMTTIPNVDAWTNIQGIEAAASVFLVQPDFPANTTLIGIDSSDPTNPVFTGDSHETVISSVSASDYDSGGLPLPADLNEVHLDVYAEAPDDNTSPIDVLLTLVLSDSAGRIYDLTLLPDDDPQLVESWQTYRVTLPQSISSWVFRGLRLDSEQDNTNILRHTVTLDHLRGITTDNSEITLLSFSEDDVANFSWASNSQGLATVTLTLNETISTQGDTSFDVSYNRRQSVATQSPFTAYRVRNLEPIPVVLSPALANLLGQRSNNSRPLRVGEQHTFNIDLVSPQTGVVSVSIQTRIVGITSSFASLGRGDAFLIADQNLLLQQFNRGQGQSLDLQANIVWLSLSEREPSTATIEAVSNIDGVKTIEYAWTRYITLLRAPLPNAIAGVLFASFWVSLVLGIIDFAFYLTVTTHQRAKAFAMLQAMGWDNTRLWRLVLIEQLLFVIPALIVGAFVGVLLASLILPFLTLTGSQPLVIPYLAVGAIVAIMFVIFVLILRIMGAVLRRFNTVQVMRFGD
ncbi:MAG: ABC transporter permease [Chloroflexota bacterium]